PLERIVLETDAPYMAPVPMRGRRNESAFIPHIVKKLAETYGVGEEMVDEVTSRTARRIFG
ncbi:MAG: TatD family hydrolase, partial [Bacteroidaceae bacterium]|nr:TatD family hydrolase [Bacteroidaceae bacterium]